MKVCHPISQSLPILLMCQPISRPTTPEEMRARCVVFNQITQGCGLGTLLEEDLIDSFVADSRGI